MPKRVNRVRYHLNSQDIKNLPQEEIAAILRGAEELITRGGRTLLAKVLKGSQEKRVLELKLYHSPVYGYYQKLTIAQILARVDWVIQNNYLAIEYDYRLPLLVYTPKGWAIEKETYATELLRGFDEMLMIEKEVYDMTYLKDKSRELILLLLDKVEASGNKAYIPLLEAWTEVDYKKVRERIKEVIHHLG